MTRQQAEEFLKSLGLEEVTSEQITNYLNSVNKEVQGAKSKNDELLEKAKKADELQAIIDEMNDKNLTELEKANKATELSNAKVAELETQLKTMQLRSSLAENGITGEDADNLLASLNGGNFDASILGKIISDKITLATAEKEKELLQGTPNPNGGQGGEPEKTSAEKIAETIGKKLGGNEKASADIISNYL